jgi:hypothetical protein
MAGALQKMLARTGKSREDFNKRSRVNKILRRSGVEDTAEFRRILNLPRRVWAEDAELDALAERLTAWLKRPGGQMKLRPVQAKALEELHDYGGLLSPIRVGGGKTLLTFLAPVVCGAERPLLIVPAKLKNKTAREFAELAKHWLYHPKTLIVSYEKISRDGGYEFLQQVNPDMIIADECHRLKSQAAGVTRKLRRWRKENRNTRWCLMSGTMTTRSLREYAHLAKWALNKLSPLPDKGNEVADWGDALDEKVDPMKRLLPGVLLGMCTDEDLALVAKDQNKATEAARRGFRRRFVETPAVVATEERALGVSLSITSSLLDVSGECKADFARLRELWQTPDGQDFTEGVDLWRHARELACGLYYRWEPEAPKPWMEARREWSKFVRETLSLRRNGIDTPFQVAKACKAGLLPARQYQAWESLRDTFKPNSVPVWRHTKTLEAAAKWLRENDGICWVEHVAFGERLAKDTGLPYFGAGGVDAKGRDIESATGPVIASIASNSEGRNLQVTWSRNLVVSAPPNGRVFEQLIGRTHREGQLADEVEFLIMFACIEQWEGFKQAERDALYVEQTTGAPQKLLYADKDILSESDVTALVRSGNPLWRTK